METRRTRAEPSSSWKKPWRCCQILRQWRVVLIRQRKKALDFVRGRELFDLPGYVFQAILTNRTDVPEEIWRFYRGHAEIETKIHELKWDYGIDGSRRG